MICANISTMQLKKLKKNQIVHIQICFRQRHRKVRNGGYSYIDTVNTSTQDTEMTSANTSNKNENSIEEQNKELIKSFRSRLPLIMMTLNPKNDLFYPDEDPLESGLLFAVLLKKFSFMLENPRMDNLILAQIWSTIASLPLQKDKPETFYLYAF